MREFDGRGRSVREFDGLFGGGTGLEEDGCFFGCLPFEGFLGRSDREGLCVCVCESDQ